jgi:hypothetical protein
VLSHRERRVRGVRPIEYAEWKCSTERGVPEVLARATLRLGLAGCNDTRDVFER